MPASAPPAVAAVAAEAGQPHSGTYLKHQPESEEQGQPLWERVDEAIGRLATTMKGRRIVIIVLLVLLLAVCLALIGAFAVPRNRWVDL